MSRELIKYCILLIVVLIPLIYRLFLPKIKGFFGEKTVAAILLLLDSSKYKVINNVVLDIQGRTSQIDHLIVSNYGVFVIETKNYKGWILGGENSEYWTQVLFKHKYKLYNPIRQNMGHIGALKKCLPEFPNLNYISVIVFSVKAEIKVTSTTDVISLFQLLHAIKKHSEVTVTNEEMEKIFEKLISINAKDNYDNKKHIKAIKSRVQAREESLKLNICPQCGSGLTSKNGKFGAFLACTAFPRCRFTRNI